MRDYELRRGQWKNIEGEQLLHLMQDVFGDTKPDGDGYAVENFGAIARLYVEYVDKKTLRVDTQMNPNVDAEEAQRTMRAWNDFLELATGYDAKERGKRAKKTVEKDAEAAT